MDLSRFRYEMRPKALSENTVVGERYRFTVLTPSLIRMEYCPNGVFEDRASQSVFFRDFPAVSYTKQSENGILTVETEELVLTYRENAEFSADTLTVRLKNSPATSWNYGEDFEDLGGTYKTLDMSNGPVPLGHGVCSRNGFSVMDDSSTMLLNDEGWVEVRTPDTTDCYFWGYGFRYREAVADLYRLTGIPPMLPAYALGNWWSRYHAYTQEEYQDLVLRFEREEVPFSVAVVDMDWHIVKIPEEYKTGDGHQFESGWTGYTWNEKLFPDYKEFLKFLHEHNLKVSLNLHPAQGVGCHEAMYEELATACGIDPKTRQRVKLDILSPEYMAKYFDIIHHPYEEDGVDFWWMDWQQGKRYWWIHEPNRDGKMQDEREVLEPLWMLNHLHIADIQRDGKRPMFFSRFGGVGSQRYPVGFSGDTYTTWDALNFQPQFTATASNVGYGWWSHDIGGHMGGYFDEDLQVRWLQLGVFSPINRLHSSPNEYLRKEPWCYSAPTEAVMKEWLQLRHRLFPYLYTMNYRCHAELQPLVQPMYYAYPQNSAAYEVKNQFFFGSELMVAPITTPTNPVSGMGRVEAWLPKGEWFDFFDGTRYVSEQGKILPLHRAADKYPVFAKAGAIVPMQTEYLLGANADPEIVVFPGANNSFTLYEDAGDGNEFETGACVKTKLEIDWENRAFTICAAEGDLSLVPETRRYTVVFRGVKPCSVAMGKTVLDSEYDEKTKSLRVTVCAAPSETVTLTLTGEDPVADNGDPVARCIEVLRHASLDNTIKQRLTDIIANKDAKLWQKMHDIYFAVLSGPDHNALVEALVEQMLI